MYNRAEQIFIFRFVFLSLIRLNKSEHTNLDDSGIPVEQSDQFSHKEQLTTTYKGAPPISELH